MGVYAMRFEDADGVFDAEMFPAKSDFVARVTFLGAVVRHLKDGPFYRAVLMDGKTKRILVDQKSHERGEVKLLV